MEPTVRSLVLGPGEGRVLDMGPFSMSVKADAALSGGAFSLLEATEPPHFGPPMHVHEDAAEVFYVLDGVYDVVVEGVAHRCEAGSFVYVAAGVEHGFRVGDVPSRKLNLYVPAAMTGYFEELAAAQAAGRAPAPDELASVAARFSMTVTGEVPRGYL
jgi:mannose-6-phosphate isomerase-like protein (cupin superfamily)